MENKKSANRSLKLFLKAIVYTACALALVAIGYFTAAFFWGGF